MPAAGAIEVVGEQKVCGTVGSFDSDASVWRRHFQEGLQTTPEAFVFLLNHTDS